jgi:general secretion pathway protein I
MKTTFSARRGFTLIEMVVALAILGLVAVAVIRLASENAQTSHHVENRLLAGIVAENLAVEAFVSPAPPAFGRSEGGVAMAGRDWRWTRLVEPTDQAGVIRIDVTVGAEGQQYGALTLVRDTGA